MTKALTRRVAMISVHTSPLDRPGSGDAGGLNVYVVETATRLAQRGVEVEIFTRATSAAMPERCELSPGVTVHHIQAGPYEGLHKEDLPGQLCAMAAGIMRIGASRPEGYYDVVHSHYWLSGQVGWLAAERWGVPLVHTMHTMARVKNRALAQGDTPEPQGREIGEAQVVQAAQRIVANTDLEAGDLVELYDADPATVRVVHPGVDLELFSPGDRAAAREALGLSADQVVVGFVGRIQPLKAPDLLIKAVADLVAQEPAWRSRLVVPVVGGPSGTGVSMPMGLAELAERLGISDLVRFEPPQDRPALVQWVRAMDLVAVPSYNESFGLVALEAQACGTPVLAARVGGLPLVVSSGALVDGHDVGTWSDALQSQLHRLSDPAVAASDRERARAGALAFGWDETVRRLLDVYHEAQGAVGDEETNLIGDSATLVGIPAAVVP